MDAPTLDVVDVPSEISTAAAAGNVGRTTPDATDAESGRPAPPRRVTPDGLLPDETVGGSDPSGVQPGPSAADREPDEVRPDVMRQVLGHFVSGVTIVTATEAGEPLGFTCQSFSSLSLDPPLVAIFPARTSGTWPRIRAIGRFCVNVLADSQAELSARFARPSADRFAGVEWSPSPLGSPRLADVVAWIDCTVWQEYDGGDHTIVAGHVEHLGAVSENLPLAFHRGTYAQLP